MKHFHTVILLTLASLCSSETIYAQISATGDSRNGVLFFPFIPPNRLDAGDVRIGITSNAQLFVRGDDETPKIVLNCNSLIIGVADNRAVGDVRVTGPGAELNTPTITASQGGRAIVTVSRGGSLSSNTAVVGSNRVEGLGVSGTASGSLRINGDGSSWRNAGSLTMGQGRSTTGSILVDGGAFLFNGLDSFIGKNFMSSSTGISVKGSSSRFENGGDVYVGGLPDTSSPTVFPGGSGRLEASDGGEIIVRGALSVRDTGTVFLRNGVLDVANGITVDGFFDLKDGSIVRAGGNLTLTENSFFRQSGGTVQATVIDASTDGARFEVSGGTLEAAEIIGGFEITGGTLDAESITGDLVQNGGAIAPGNSPGTTSIDGDYLINNGSLEIELGGTTAGAEYDLIDISGEAAFAGGDLDVSFLNDFGESVLATDTFTILTADNGLSGSLAELADGARLTTSDGVGSFQVSYSSNSITLGDFIAAPEPVLLGDVNLDSTVDFFDISPFIAVLSAGATQAEADCNEDGVVSFLDISSFIAILSVPQ